MLERAESYEALRAGFRWNIPARHNIGVDVCDKWADGSGRLALIHLRRDGSVERWSFDAFKRESNRLANALAGHGVARGARIGILLPQRPETALAHLAAYKLGAVAAPLFTLFGPEALAYRLADSGARVLIADREGLAKLAEIRGRLPDLALVLSVDGPGDGALDLRAEMTRASDALDPMDSAADDPALIIYTSGTTGPPKGALHAHRVLLGHLAAKLKRTRCVSSHHRGLLSPKWAGVYESGSIPAEEMQFSRRWNGGTISLNLGVISEMSAYADPSNHC